MHKGLKNAMKICIVGLLLFIITTIQKPELYQAATIPTLKTTSKTLYANYDTYTIGINHLSRKATVQYKSLDANIAKVSSKGLVEPVAQGNTQITVTIKQNKKTYKRNLKVSVKNPYINITEQTTSIIEGDNYPFIAKVYGSKATVQWESSDESIASFESNEYLIGNKLGTITVTATAGDLKTSCQVTITEKHTKKLTISGNSEMIVGETNKYAVTDKDLVPEWWLSDRKKADHESGIYDDYEHVMALEPGTVTLYAQSEDAQGELTIQINPLEIIGDDNINVAKEAYYTINSKQLLRQVDWEIKDGKIAELEYDGDGIYLTGKKEGSTVLTLFYFTSTGEERKINKTIVVGQIPDFTINGDSTMTANESKEYSVNLSENADVEWKVSDPSMAYVNSTGNKAVLTSARAGTVTLTATFGNKQASRVITVTKDNTWSTSDIDDFVISGKNIIATGSTIKYTVNLPRDTQVEWKVSDSSIASVNGTGTTAELTPTKAGKLTLTAFVGKKQVTMDITVTGSDGSGTPKPNDSKDTNTNTNTNTNNNSNTNDKTNTQKNNKDHILKDGVYYDLKDSYACATGVADGTVTANILSEIEGVPVTHIAGNFSTNSPSLKQLSCSSSAIILEDGCFKDSKLESIKLQSDSISIGTWAFNNCKSLVSLNLVGNVKEIDPEAFLNCSSLTELTIPGNETTYVGFMQSYFKGCSSLKKLHLESKIVFDDPRNEQYLLYGMWDFTNSSQCLVEDLYLNIEQITSQFLLRYTSPNLRKLTLENTVSICTNGATDQGKLVELNLPQTLTSIGNEAFENCESLTVLNLPEGLTSIGQNAFRSCNSLSTLILPQTLTSIGEKAFFNCSNLNNIECKATLETDVESVFDGTKYGEIVYCYLNGAENLLNREDRDFIQSALTALNTIKAEASNDYDVIKGCHDWISNHTVYDWETYNKVTNGDMDGLPQDAFSAKGLFKNGKAVCDGYSKAFKALMDLAGIECRIVVGTSRGEGHAWNIVKLDSSYYQIDCTWDDQDDDTIPIKYDYFLVNDTKMLMEHTWNNANYPACPNNYTADDTTLGQK